MAKPFFPLPCRSASDYFTHARQHDIGVELIAGAYEMNSTLGDVSLMITKHCLRYTFNLCPKEAKGWQLKGIHAEPIFRLAAEIQT